MSCRVTSLVGMDHNWVLCFSYLSRASSKNERQGSIGFANALFTCAVASKLHSDPHFVVLIS